MDNMARMGLEIGITVSRPFRRVDDVAIGILYIL